MGPLAGNLFLRLAGVLLAAVVLFNLVMAWLLFAPLGEERSELYRLPVATQASAIVEILDPADAATRRQILDAVNSRSLTVSIVASKPARTGESGLVASGVERFLQGYDEVFAQRDIDVEVRRPGFLRRIFGGGEGWEASRIYVSLSDGNYVLFEPARAAAFDTFLSRGMAIMGGAGVIVLIGLWFAVRRTARPIADLAGRAHRLADDLNAPDIPAARGPREIRDLTAAFNHMKGRIAALVAERTRLVAAVTHDLRTYLTRLRLRSEFIADDDQRARAERDISEMSALVDDTLLFAAADQGGAREKAATDIAAETARFVALRRETGDPVSLGSTPPGPLTAAIDTLAFQRLLANLTDNAIRYGKTARLALAASGEALVLTVDDDGPGVPDAELKRITEPFARLEPSRARASGGAGLGLAIVSALAAAYGGTLTLANRPGGGLSAAIALKRA